MMPPYNNARCSRCGGYYSITGDDPGGHWGCPGPPKDKVKANDDAYNTPGGILYLCNLAKINPTVVPPEGVSVLAAEVTRLREILEKK